MIEKKTAMVMAASMPRTNRAAKAAPVVLETEHTDERSAMSLGNEPTPAQSK